MKIHGESNRNSGVLTPRLALDDGGLHLGIWIVTRDPLVVDIVSAESFDWVCIDAQHGGPQIDEVQLLIEGAHMFGVPSIVRVPGHEFGTICRVIDAGAGGLIFPTVENAQTAEFLVSACRFPPRGKRSYSPTRRSPRYPKPVPGNPHDDPACIVMIETVEGLENLDGILAAGPDGVFVGPYDLALSLGVTLEELFGGGPDGVLADIARRCNAAGVAPGLYTGEPEVSAKMIALGYRFMPTASDIGLLGVGAREAVAASKLLV